MVLLLHIAYLKDWNKAKMESEYIPESLKTEGFIHCSLMNQIIDVANNFYANQQNLVFKREILKKNL